MSATLSNTVSVAMLRCAAYARPSVERAVGELLDACGWRPGAGSRVLVKPNLLRAAPLACTHPEVVRAACSWLLDRRVRVVVADSPGFGTARGVAEAVGLAQALEDLGLTVHGMGEPVPVALPDGGRWGVSRLALECDALLSVPRVKAHAQMRVTLAVKNLFGCVCGLRKAVAHTVQGDRPGVFAACVAALWAALPPVAGLADGITAMHVTGPAGGQPFQLGLLAASPCAVALDTALYTTIGVAAPAVPVWDALIRRGAPGALPENIAYPLQTPQAFPAQGFRVPETLVDVSFRPHRLAWSLCRRVWRSLRS